MRIIFAVQSFFFDSPEKTFLKLFKRGKFFCLIYDTFNVFRDNNGDNRRLEKETFEFSEWRFYDFMFIILIFGYFPMLFGEDKFHFSFVCQEILFCFYSNEVLKMCKMSLNGLWNQVRELRRMNFYTVTSPRRRFDFLEVTNTGLEFFWFWILFCDFWIFSTLWNFLILFSRSKTRQETTIFLRQLQHSH